MAHQIPFVMKKVLFAAAILLSVFLFQSQTGYQANSATAYPYATKQMKFQSQRQPVSMTYMFEKATQGNGKTVVLLHGKNFSGQYWGDVMAKLLANGYNVLAPDQIGFGASSMPGAYQFSFQQLAENTKLLMDSLGIKKAIVLGHSMGGMLATRFALMYPETVSQLILEDPIGLEDWKTMVPYTPVEEEYKKELAKTRESVKKYMMENYFHNEWKKEYDYLLEPTTNNPGAIDYYRKAWCMALTSDMIFTQPVCYEFDQLKVPTVLIIGQKDRTAIGKDKVSKEKAAQMGNYPELGKSTAAKIKNSTLVEMPDAGHIPHVEQFELFMSQLMNVIQK
jgi:pimeloyl-ACP methyl ester carboxylesterase